MVILHYAASSNSKILKHIREHTYNHLDSDFSKLYEILSNLYKRRLKEDGSKRTNTASSNCTKGSTNCTVNLALFQ